MTKQEYITIRELAWNILYNCHICKLPIEITPIAEFYNLKHFMDYSESRYNNARIISYHILSTYGLPTTNEFINGLTIRLLSPLCILHECNISSPQSISKYCDIPIYVSQQRALRLKAIASRNKFYLSDMERKVVNNFKPFIQSFN